MPKQESGHTIMILKTPILSKEDFWDRIFWARQHKNIKGKEYITDLSQVGRLIYEMILTGEFNKYRPQEFMKKFGVSYARYYMALSTLKDLGLIRKEHGDYVPSREFVVRLQRLIEYVEGYLSQAPILGGKGLGVEK